MAKKQGRALKGPNYIPALMNRMRSDQTRGNLCETGQKELKWWLKQGKTFGSIVEAITSWNNLARVNEFLEWLGKAKISGPRSGDRMLTDLKNYGFALTPEEAAAIKAAVDGLNKPEDLSKKIREALPSDASFERLLAKWDWK